MNDLITQIGLLHGRKAICNYLDISDSTYKRYKKIGMPIRYNPGGRPFALPLELIEWMTILGEKKKKAKEKRGHNFNPKKTTYVSHK